MYLDPGFGSMVIQMLIAAIAVGGVMLFTLRQKIANFFKQRKRKENSEEGTKDTPPHK